MTPTGELCWTSTKYQDLLRFNRAIDLDGLILQMNKLLSKNEELLQIYTRQAQHLLVDEYQDINQAQFKMIKLLAGNASGLFVVGDDDQSIYSWRGANLRIVLNFQDDFKGAQVENLEESRRCTEHILDGALGLIRNNKAHYKKVIKAVKTGGSLIHILDSRSEVKEAKWITDWVIANTSDGRIKLQDIAILCKDIKLANDVVSELRKREVKVRYWKEGKIFNDKSVRDLLAHIRILNDLSDNLALRRCLMSSSGKGIRDEGIRNLRALAQRNESSLWAILINAKVYEDLKKWGNRFKKFEGWINDLRGKCTHLGIDKIVDMIIEKIGISGNVNVDKFKDFVSSLPLGLTVEDLLVDVYNKQGLDITAGGAEPEDKEDAVAVMSMHSSKGLTYKVVFILGMEKGIFPNPKDDLEEQRRLCYVAMTRAKEELFMCHAKRRMGRPAQGFKLYKEHSCFVSEIPIEHREIIKVG